MIFSPLRQTAEDLLHSAATSGGIFMADDNHTTTSRLGLVLFWIYVALYGSFMGLVLVRPDLLSWRPFGGVNLAIASGMGLIAAAFILAVIYMAARAGR
jgi:uncharacterized membrane protein (DUF485 family)